MLNTKAICDAAAEAGGVSWWKMRKIIRATLAVASEALVRGETVDFSVVKLKVRRHTGHRKFWNKNARNKRKKYVSFRSRNKVTPSQEV